QEGPHYAPHPHLVDEGYRRRSEEVAESCLRRRCGLTGHLPSPMPTWNPQQYLKFAEERSRPCRDLAARVEVAAPQSIIDLGCGPGNSAEILAARWPRAAITGLDSSA